MLSQGINIFGGEQFAALFGSIIRNFTTIDDASGMYYQLPTYQMAVGDTVEFKYLAPSVTTGDTDELFGGDVTGGSDAHFRMLSGGAFAETGFENTFLLDGASVSTTSTYPIDGKIHTVKLTSDSTLSISALAGKQAGTDTYSGIIYDVVIKNSGGTIQRNYPIDETWINSNVLVDKATVLGPEEVANGDFDTDLSSWNVSNPSFITWDAGTQACYFKNVSTNNVNISQAAMTIGTQYYVSIEIKEYVSGGLVLVNPTDKTFNITGDGVYVLLITATQAEITLKRSSAQGPYDFKVDNVKVKEASGYGTAVNVDVDDSEPFTFDGAVSPNTWTNEGATRIFEVAGT